MNIKELRDEITTAIAYIGLIVGLVLGAIMFVADIALKIEFSNLDSFMFFTIETTIISIYGIICWIILIVMWMIPNKILDKIVKDLHREKSD